AGPTAEATTRHPPRRSASSSRAKAATERSLIRSGPMRPVTVACFIALAACSRTKTETTHVYDAYEGGAPYPNLRPKLAADGDDFALVPNSGSDSISFL